MANSPDEAYVSTHGYNSYYIICIDHNNNYVLQRKELLKDKEKRNKNMFFPSSHIKSNTSTEDLVDISLNKVKSESHVFPLTKFHYVFCT